MLHSRHMDSIRIMKHRIIPIIIIRIMSSSTMDSSMANNSTIVSSMALSSTMVNSMALSSTMVNSTIHTIMASTQIPMVLTEI